jgi:uncharacterized protein YwqG
MWSKSELETLLSEAGLAQWAARLAALARPTIILAPGPIEEAGNAPLGASRLGGKPDLPPELDWPLRPPFKPRREIGGSMPGHVVLGPRHWLHRLFRTRRWKSAAESWENARRAERDVRKRAWPMSFVAQIDFAELHAVHPLEGFPATGRLLLFCDPFDWPWGKRDDQARARALFTDAPLESLKRRGSPPEFDEPDARILMPRGYVFKPRILRPTAWLLPPSQGSRQLLALKAEEPDTWEYEGEAFSAYDEFWRRLHARHPDIFGEHGDMILRVGGIADSIQEPVEEEAARAADGAPELADSWQLVLQIDSDIEAGMEWGDLGRLYLCARRDDLIAGRFDQCWLIMQCY